MSHTLLFVCTGNYYRSRFAELWFNHLAAARGLRWVARSAGLATESNHLLPGVISPIAVAALAERGVALPDRHRDPIPCVDADFHAADRVIALNADEHRPLMQARHPAWADLIEYWNIHDVHTAPAELMIAELDHRVRTLVDELAAMGSD